eukprot:GHVQ01016458.1.p1 GENE.GHVQ01016458.1~~GHVQ01016458.1.p1  ORF type:complete len:1723 (+),score=202.48 GHVQ01016458.1:1524-6692(+)
MKFCFNSELYLHICNYCIAFRCVVSPFPIVTAFSCLCLPQDAILFKLGLALCLRPRYSFRFLQAHNGCMEDQDFQVVTQARPVFCVATGRRWYTRRQSATEFKSCKAAWKLFIRKVFNIKRSRSSMGDCLTKWKMIIVDKTQRYRFSSNYNHSLPVMWRSFTQGETKSGSASALVRDLKTEIHESDLHGVSLPALVLSHADKEAEESWSNVAIQRSLGGNDSSYEDSVLRPSSHVPCISPNSRVSCFEETPSWRRSINPYCLGFSTVSAPPSECTTTASSDMRVPNTKVTATVAPAANRNSVVALPIEHSSPSLTTDSITHLSSSKGDIGGRETSSHHRDSNSGNGGEANMGDSRDVPDGADGRSSPSPRGDTVSHRGDDRTTSNRFGDELCFESFVASVNLTEIVQIVSGQRGGRVEIVDVLSEDVMKNVEQSFHLLWEEEQSQKASPLGGKPQVVRCLASVLDQENGQHLFLTVMCHPASLQSDVLDWMGLELCSMSRRFLISSFVVTFLETRAIPAESAADSPAIRRLWARILRSVFSDPAGSSLACTSIPLDMGSALVPNLIALWLCLKDSNNKRKARRSGNQDGGGEEAVGLSGCEEERCDGPNFFRRWRDFVGGFCKECSNTGLYRLNYEEQESRRGNITQGFGVCLNLSDFCFLLPNHITDDDISTSLATRIPAAWQRHCPNLMPISVRAAKVCTVEKATFVVIVILFNQHTPTQDRLLDWLGLSLPVTSTPILLVDKCSCDVTLLSTASSAFPITAKHCQVWTSILRAGYFLPKATVRSPNVSTKVIQSIIKTDFRFCLLSLSCLFGTLHTLPPETPSSHRPPKRVLRMLEEARRSLEGNIKVYIASGHPLRPVQPEISLLFKHAGLSADSPVTLDLSLSLAMPVSHPWCWDTPQEASNQTHTPSDRHLSASSTAPSKTLSYSNDMANHPGPECSEESNEGAAVGGTSKLISLSHCDQLLQTSAMETGESADSVSGQSETVQTELGGSRGSAGGIESSDAAQTVVSLGWNKKVHARMRRRQERHATASKYFSSTPSFLVETLEAPVPSSPGPAADGNQQRVCFKIGSKQPTAAATNIPACPHISAQSEPTASTDCPTDTYTPTTIPPVACTLSSLAAALVLPSGSIPPTPAARSPPASVSLSALSTDPSTPAAIGDTLYDPCISPTSARRSASPELVSQLMVAKHRPNARVSRLSPSPESGERPRPGSATPATNYVYCLPTPPCTKSRSPTCRRAVSQVESTERPSVLSASCNYSNCSLHNQALKRQEQGTVVAGLGKSIGLTGDEERKFLSLVNLLREIASTVRITYGVSGRCLTHCYRARYSTDMLRLYFDRYQRLPLPLKNTNLPAPSPTASAVTAHRRTPNTDCEHALYALCYNLPDLFLVDACILYRYLDAVLSDDCALEYRACRYRHRQRSPARTSVTRRSCTGTPPSSVSRRQTTAPTRHRSSPSGTRDTDSDRSHRKRLRRQSPVRGPAPERAVSSTHIGRMGEGDTTVDGGQNKDERQENENTSETMNQSVSSSRSKSMRRSMENSPETDSMSISPVRKRLLDNRRISSTSDEPTLNAVTAPAADGSNSYVASACSPVASMATSVSSRATVYATAGQSVPELAGSHISKHACSTVADVSPVSNSNASFGVVRIMEPEGSEAPLSGVSQKKDLTSSLHDLLGPQAYLLVDLADVDTGRKGKFMRSIRKWRKHRAKSLKVTKRQALN